MPNTTGAFVADEQEFLMQTLLFVTVGMESLSEL